MIVVPLGSALTVLLNPSCLTIAVNSFVLAIKHDAGTKPRFPRKVLADPLGQKTFLKQLVNIQFQKTKVELYFTKVFLANVESIIWKQ